MKYPHHFPDFSRRFASLCIVTSMLGNIVPLSTFADSSIFGTTDSNPYGIAIDASGNIYTANSSNNTVTKITPDGSSSYFGSTGNYPQGIAVDTSGNVYTANSNSNTVTKISADGSSDIISWGTTGAGAQSLAIDGSGNVYVANYSNNTVTKITPDGTSSYFGSTGIRPQGIAVDGSGNVYTANSSSNTVTKISADGSSDIISWGTTGTAPVYIAVDGSGNVYTTNYQSNTVTKITPDGTSDISWGTTGAYPYGIAIDGSGNVYTTNNNYNTVTKITPDGTSRIIGIVGAYPLGIAVDASGNVYTTNLYDNNVTKIVPPYISSPVIHFRDPTTAVINKYIGRDNNHYYDLNENNPYWVDDIDGEGDFSEATTGSVDLSHTGTYTLTYSHTDGSGNTTNLDRTVNILDFADMSHISTYSTSPALYGKVYDPEIQSVDVTIKGNTYNAGVYTDSSDNNKHFWYLPEGTIDPELAPGSYNVKLVFYAPQVEWTDTYTPINRCLTIIGSGSIAPCVEGSDSDAADISLSKTLTNTGEIHAGDTVGYTFTVTNLSTTENFTSDNMTFEDAMPDIVDMGSGTIDTPSEVLTDNASLSCQNYGLFRDNFDSSLYGDYPNTNSINCYPTEALALSPGESMQFTMTGTALADFSEGLTNQAVVVDWNSDTTDPESKIIQTAWNGASDNSTFIPEGLFGFTGNNVAKSIYQPHADPAPFCDPAAIGVRTSVVTAGSCNIGTASGFLSTSSGGVMNYSWSCNTETQSVSCDASYTPGVTPVVPPASTGGGGSSPLPLPIPVSTSGIGNTGTIVSTNSGKNIQTWTKDKKILSTKFTATAPISSLGNGIEIAPNICTSILKVHNLSDIHATDLGYNEFRSSIQKLIMYRGDWTQADGTLPNLQDGIANNTNIFDGTKNITRGDYVTMLVRALGCIYEPGEKTVMPFPDVSDSLASSLYVNYAVSQKWINGYADGNFRPDAPISRGEAAKILANAIYMSTNQLKQSNLNIKNLAFEDLQNGNEFAKYVYALKQGGILNGKSPVLFGVDDPISRQEVAKVFASTFLKGIQ